MSKFSLDDFLPYNLTLATDKLVSSVYKVYSKYGIDKAQWRILVFLGDEKSAPSLKIRNLSLLDKSAFSRATVALEKKGWIVVDIDANDNRHKNLTLSDTGEEKYNEIVAEVAKWNENLRDEIGEDDIKKLISLSKKIIQKY